jgi:hypothetical protein
MMKKRPRTHSFEGLFKQEKELNLKFDENDYINTFNCSFKKEDFEDDNLFTKDLDHLFGGASSTNRKDEEIDIFFDFEVQLQK